MPNRSSSKGCCHQILFCLCDVPRPPNPSLDNSNSTTPGPKLRKMTAEGWIPKQMSEKKHQWTLGVRCGADPASCWWDDGKRGRGKLRIRAPSCHKWMLDQIGNHHFTMKGLIYECLSVMLHNRKSQCVSLMLLETVYNSLIDTD